MEKVHTDKSPGRTTRDDIDGNSIVPIIGEILTFTGLGNSYTMGCGDNPRALASGLSYVQMDNAAWYNYFIAPTSV